MTETKTKTPEGLPAGDGPPPEDLSTEDLSRRLVSLDASIVGLWKARKEVSRRLEDLRVAAGTTRTVLSQEQAVLQRYREGLGPVGTRLALLLLDTVSD